MLKDELLKALYGGERRSGEELAARFGVTRAAVWKAARQLEAEGFAIDVGKDGYLLPRGGGRLAAELIKSPVRVCFYDTVDSTNEEAKRLFSEKRETLAVAAREQTRGKGRSGKSFSSAKDNGVYLSVVFRPEEIKIPLGLVTVAAAVAVRRAMAVCGCGGTEIKWVNDIFYKGKKVAGILCEAVTDMEDGGVGAVVCGAGVNTGSDGLTGPLSEVAGHIDAEKNLLASEMIKNICGLLKEGDVGEIVSEYRGCQLVLGKEVVFTKDGKEYRGVAAGIGDGGELLVKTEEGEIAVKSGAVSLGSEKYAK